MNVYVVDGAQLPAGMDFTTHTMRVDTAEEAEAFGVAVGGFAAVQVQHRYADLESWDQDQMGRWGASVIVEPDPPTPLPPEVPMYRVKIVLAQQGLTAGVTAYLAGLSEPEKTIAQTLWDGAPNLVVQGAFALQVKAAMGLSDDQYAALVQAAMGLDL